MSYSVRAMPSTMLGHDCELSFVNGKGQAYPATLLYPKPERGMYNGNQYWYEIGQDGRQAEMRGQAMYCRAWLADGMWHSMSNACQKAKDNGLQVECKSAVPMLMSSIKKGGENCVVSGCNPDFDWKGTPNTTLHVFSKAPYCFSGVHLHASPPKESAIWKNFSKNLHVIDTLVGVTMEAICYDKSSALRRRFYGRAGCHRPTQYGEDNYGGKINGVEYRTLGGWCLRSPGLMSLAMGFFKMSVGLAYYPEFLDRAAELLTREEVEGVINNCDREGAAKLVKSKILPFFDDLFMDPTCDCWNMTHKKNTLMYSENPVQHSLRGAKCNGRKVYEMALDGADFFSGTAVDKLWKIGQTYISHAGTAHGWKDTSTKIIAEIDRKKESK